MKVQVTAINRTYDSSAFTLLDKLYCCLGYDSDMCGLYFGAYRVLIQTRPYTPSKVLLSVCSLCYDELL